MAAHDPRFESLSGAASVEAALDVPCGGEGLCDLYRPVTCAERRLPVVGFIHGGGWHGGDKADYGDLAARVADRGYLCAAVNYRLSGQAAFPAALEDCKRAVRWLRAHAAAWGADTDRMATWGHSAGGHLAALVALTPGRFEPESAPGRSDVQAAVCYSTPLDVAGLGESLRGSVERFLGIPAGADGLREREQASPIRYVDRGAPPFFVCHGEDDDLVPVEQSERFVAALREAGGAVEFVRVAGAGHDLERHSREVFEAAVRFLDDHLGR